METPETRKMRDLSLVIGILTACETEIATVGLFIKALPPEIEKDLNEAAALIQKAKNFAVREFSNQTPAVIMKRLEQVGQSADSRVTEAIGTDLEGKPLIQRSE